MGTFVGKIALVTGTSRGIGTYIAKTLAKDGATIVAVARTKEGLDKTCAEIERGGGKAFAVPFDLQQIDLISDLVKQVNKMVGPVDILINNAGIWRRRHYADYSPDELNSIITLNLIAPMELTRNVLPGMLQRDWGHIVNISSLSGKKAEPFNTVDSASKAGLLMWSDGLRQELHGTNVHISVILPGYVSEAGVFPDSGLEAPALLGTSKPQDVAEAVVKAIKKHKAEIIVSKGPIKPLLAIGQLSPTFADTLVRWFGIVKLSRRRVEPRK